MKKALAIVLAVCFIIVFQTAVFATAAGDKDTGETTEAASGSSGNSGSAGGGESATEGEILATTATQDATVTTNAADDSAVSSDDTAKSTSVDGTEQTTGANGEVLDATAASSSTDEAAQVTTQAHKTGNGYWIYYIIGGVILLAVAAFLWMKKRSAGK